MSAFWPNLLKYHARRGVRHDMVHTLRFVATIIVLLCSFSSVRHAHSAAALERGTAIIDPLALRELDHGSFGLGHVMAPASTAEAALTNKELFALPSMAGVHKALEAEFDKYILRHKAALPTETIGVGYFYDFQLFDRALLDSPDTRFVLAGIVNRMDRAYVHEASCGEVRLIYRLTRTDLSQSGDGAVSPRLPMTLNVILKARGDRTSSGDALLTCAEIARRWLEVGDLALTGTALSEKLTAPDGPLSSIRPENLTRIETNLQIAHAPKSSLRDFRTDYLMKVFDFNPHSQAFEEARLENQIDRDRILADENLGREFKAWLLDPRHFAELDRGTLLIPEKFLALNAIAPTPVGFASPNLRPVFGHVQRGDAPAEPLFKEQDVVAALKKAAERGVALSNIRSMAGFERRLDDITCAGCHQTRGIGGFHFPGVDWMAAKPDNSRVVPASPHFFADQIRRRDILASFRDGKRLDFSRGFADRPQPRGSAELAGTEYEDGWGAHCYVKRAMAAENDKSFSAWTCAKGLACKPLGNEIRMGMCFVK
jgi:hypothetical protein